MMCGYDRCPVDVPARLSAWFYHLQYTHRLSNSQCLELMAERAADATLPDEDAEPEPWPVTALRELGSRPRHTELERPRRTLHDQATSP